MPDWLTDDGIWILVTLASATVASLVLHLVLRRGIRRVVRWLEASDNLSILAGSWKLVGHLLELGLQGLIVTGAALGILWAVDVGVDPALDKLSAAGNDILGWVTSHGLRILFILIVTTALVKLLRTVVPKYLQHWMLRGIDPDSPIYQETTKQAQTLASVLNGAITVVLLLVAGFMLLSELNLNIAPVLAGVGVAGIAIGFGAQHLVRDVIGGAFILLENQYRIGDVVAVGGKIGLVEEINLRRTVLRDLDGIVHVVPNGEVTVSSNYTKEFSRANLDISVAYKEDLEFVIGVINRVGNELAQDPYYGPLIREAPQVLRVNGFEDSGIAIKILGVTEPLKQWEVMGALRLRLKKAFDQEGIEIPFPHRTLYWGTGAAPWQQPEGDRRGRSLQRPQTSEQQEGSAERLPPEDGGR